MCWKAVKSILHALEGAYCVRFPQIVELLDLAGGRKDAQPLQHVLVLIHADNDFTVKALVLGLEHRLQIDQITRQIGAFFSNLRATAFRDRRIGIRQIVRETVNSGHALFSSNAQFDGGGRVTREMLDAVGEDIQIIGGECCDGRAQDNKAANPEKDLAEIRIFLTKSINPSRTLAKACKATK